MKNKKLLILVLAVSFGFPFFVIAETVSNKYEEANKLIPEAAKLINAGNLDEGLKILKQTILIAPEEPDIHMNYASVLFVKGQRLFQSRYNESAKAIFSEVEDELMVAIKLYEKNQLKDKDDHSKAQCYFLLGDIYYYVYEDNQKAKSLYQKALEYNPNHTGAAGALEKIAEPK